MTDYFGEHNSYKVKRNKDYLKGIGRKKSEYDWKARYAVKALRNGFGLLLPSHDDPDNPKKDDQQRPSLLKTGLDAWDAVDKVNDVMGLYDDWRNAKKYVETAELYKAAGLIPKNKILAKANPILSGIGTLFGAVETVDNFVKGDVASGIQSLGDTLMSAGPLIALASPPAGFVVGVVGGGLWLGATIYKNWPAIKHGFKKLVNDPIGFGKDLVNDTVSAVKKAGELVSKGWNKVKGWFS